MHKGHKRMYYTSFFMPLPRVFESKRNDRKITERFFETFQ
jgi:hypothetical protein